MNIICAIFNHSLFEVKKTEVEFCPKAAKRMKKIFKDFKEETAIKHSSKTTEVTEEIFCKRCDLILYQKERDHER